LRNTLGVNGAITGQGIVSTTIVMDFASRNSVCGDSTTTTMSKAYEITYSPIDPLGYNYVVEANNEAEAIKEAYENFQFDIGSDRAKDFEVSNIICSDDE